jgi:hypothetical protein
MSISNMNPQTRTPTTTSVIVLVRLILGLALVLGPAASGRAETQQQMKMAEHRGGVAGIVRNAAGNVVNNATVTAVHAETGATFTAPTDDQGRYAFTALPVGRYVFTIDAAGLTVYRNPAVEVAADRTLDLNINLDAVAASQAAESDRQQLLERISTLEQRINELESSAVLSEPETRVRRVEVYVDENGNEYDQPQPGARQTVTYRRERVYRRQTINEKIEQALEDAEKRGVTVGVDAAFATQGARRFEGPEDSPTGEYYQLASADLFFTAGLAQYTLFFADIVGLSGAPPDAEIPTLTLLNGYTARLVNQNELNLREAWLRTELFGQKLALSAGRLDLTNYFDQNAVANDESTQFISDALVNNQMLGLAVNGTGVAAEFDAKTGFRARFGFQQSSTDATNLSDAIYTLSEVGYTLTPFALPEGTYRVWFRTDNTAPEVSTAIGISADQKINPVMTLFTRYGSQEAGDGRDYQFSAGVGFQNGLVFTPLDNWGIGYSQIELFTGESEKLTEGYYNFHLTERLRLSFHLTHVIDTPESESKFGYFLPGIRLQAAF